MRFICRQIWQIISWMALIRHKHKYHPKLECGLPISYSTLRLLLIYFYSFISIYILIYASVIGIFQLNLDIVYSLYHLVKMMLIKTEGMADKGTLYIWQTDPHKERKREADISPDSNRYSSVVVGASLKSPNLQNNVILVTQKDVYTRWLTKVPLPICEAFFHSSKMRNSLFKIPYYSRVSGFK